MVYPVEHVGPLEFAPLHVMQIQSPDDRHIDLLIFFFGKIRNAMREHCATVSKEPDTSANPEVKLQEKERAGMRM